MNEKIRISDLKNFVLISKFKTLSQAALSIGVTQPSLSESIIRLESDLGYKIFFRTRSGVTLTPEGKAALERAKIALSAFEQVAYPDSEGLAGRHRTIIFGCHPVVGSYVLPIALTELSQSAPELQIKIEHGLSRNIQSQVQTGQIDLAVVVNPSASLDLVIKKKQKDVFGVWKPKHRQFDPSRLILDPTLFQTQSILRRWRDAPLRIIETSSLDLIARLVSNGIGFGILPQRLVRLLGLPLTLVEEFPKSIDEIAILHRPEFGRLGYEKKCILALEGD